MSVIDKFLPLVLESEDDGASAPIIVMENVTFVYIKHNNLYSILPDHCYSYALLVTHALS